ncbi:CCR4-NOT transcription complex subunit 4-like [Acanthaster planci]|uniref:CCR4-NOT transcription complex subunit 4 n=1 Tax=Acanthaster planci TaxID=133434 RepID=A0A8B7YUH9_ACAPL|nr:CCR4-NOT transcription complex subunit 4-like [Acanthaster planci]
MKPEAAGNNVNNIHEPDDCPLCMEPLEIDDINFFPCTCGYQICRFCWHRIRTDENGLCPACRKAYPECPADFKPLTEEELQRIKNEKRQKDHQRKQKITDSRKHLASVRVVQRNLVFVVGLSQRLADTEVLKKQEYFGRFGKIVKVVINQNTSYAGSQGPSASAYVTYYKYEDALKAIQAVNNVHVDGRTLKASLGTTKYCSHFLKNSQCPKPDCMYLHELGDSAASFTKEDMQAGKHQEYEQKLAQEVLGGGTGQSQSAHSTAPSTQHQHQHQSQQPQQQQHQQQQSQQQSKRQTETPPLPQQQQPKQKSGGGSGSSGNEHSKKHSKSSRKKPSASPATSQNNSPPANNTDPWPVTNHGDPWPTTNSSDTWPALAGQAKSSEPYSQSPEDTPPLVSNHTPETLGQSPPTGISIQTKGVRQPSTEGLPPPSPEQSQPVPTGSTSSQSNQKSSFEADKSLPSFLAAANGYMNQGVLPGLAPPHPHVQPPVNGSGFQGGSTVPPLIPPRQGPTSAGDWSEGVILNNDLLPVASHTDWQAAFGFSSGTKDLLNEDDLGFDPWNESNKGLADLLEKELQLGIAVASDPVKATQPPPGFTIPANHGLGSDAGSSKMLNWLQMDRPADSKPQHISSPPSFNNRNPRPHHSPSQAQTKHPESVKSWQDGLRALLPNNINISFDVANPAGNTARSATHKNSDIWPGMQSQTWMVHDPAIISVNSHSTHAPGFTEKEVPTEEQPHWLKSLQTLTDGDTPSHPSANHLFPAHAYANRGPAWTTHAPPPGLRPPTNSTDTHSHTLTENPAV